MVGKRSSRALIGRNPVRNEARFRPSSLRFGGACEGRSASICLAKRKTKGGWFIGASKGAPGGEWIAPGTMGPCRCRLWSPTRPGLDLGPSLSAQRCGRSYSGTHPPQRSASTQASLGPIADLGSTDRSGLLGAFKCMCGPDRARSGEHASLRCDTWGQAIGGGGGASSSIARRGWLGLRQGRHRGSCAVRHFSDSSPRLRSERIVWRPLTTCPRRQREAPRRPCLPRSRHPPPWRRSCSLPPESRARPVLPTVLGRRTCRRRRRETHPAGR